MNIPFAPVRQGLLPHTMTTKIKRQPTKRASRSPKKGTDSKLTCHAQNKGDQQHPDHSYALTSLNRVQGQLSGIEKMIQNRRYCVDILVQFRAAMAAMRNLEVEVFNTHLSHCVSDAVRLRNPKEVKQKIAELTELLIRRTQL